MSQLADHAETGSGGGERTAPVMRAIPWPATWIMLMAGCAVANAGLVFAAHGGRGFFLPLAALGVAVLAGLFDAHTHRIPNALTYPAIGLGLVMNGVVPFLPHAVSVWMAPAGLGSSAAGFFVCVGLALIVPLFAPNAVHGGDLKLLAALGAILGLAQMGSLLVFALIVAMAYALLNLLAMGQLNVVMRVAARHALEMIYLRRLPRIEEEAFPLDKMHIPMAVPLALGLIVAALLQMRFGNGGLF